MEEKVRQPQIALAMIVRAVDEEAPYLADTLANLAGHVDAIYLDLNSPEGTPISSKVKKLAQQYTKHIRERVWTGNFVRARNDCFDQVPADYDWLLWLDADDKVDDPAMIRRLLLAVPDQVEGIYVTYDYAHDDWGNTVVAHDVLRLVRNTGHAIWKSSVEDGVVSVHETLQFKRPTASRKTEDFKVVHQSNPERMQDSLYRNTELLEAMLERHTAQGQIDPRILFYLATHYFDLGYYDRVKELLIRYLKLSGWDEERSEAHVYLGRILAGEGKLREARTAFHMAISENVANPRPYIELGKLEYRAKRYQQAAWLLTDALNRPKSSTTMVQRPADNLFEGHLYLAQALVNLGGPKLEEATKQIELALKLRPSEPGAKKVQELIIELTKERDDLKAVTRAFKLIGDGDVLAFTKMLPEYLQASPPVVQAFQAHTPPRKWPHKSLAIYCPPGPLGIWGPWRLTEGGISGSEEAVIQLSKRMAARGWEVVVYGTPGIKEGTYDGVEWKQYWQLNAKDEFDVLVAWRSPWMFDTEWKARKRYLWMHDVMDDAELGMDRIDRLDRVIFMSQYHANFYPWIPEDKVFISGNGIDPEQFKGLKPGKRPNPHRLVYMSDHVRGLRLLYEMWPEIKKAVKDATLDVYYGWEGFDAVNRDNPERMAWKQEMVQWAERLDGVTDHGRIDHEQVVKELSTARFLAYPCTFPEVYCITLIKAMAAGCVPVTSNYGVLADFNTWGPAVNFSKVPTQIEIRVYKDTLISMLQGKPQSTIKRIDMMKDTWKKFSWDNTAQQWDADMEK